MAANNGGGHISFVGQAAAGDAAADFKSPVYEKGIQQDMDSVYDEEDIIQTKESDYKHRQVRAQTQESNNPSGYG